MGDDSLPQWILSRNFVGQLWAGDFYPRWMWDINAGFGSPAFQFYGPVPFYITALLKPLLSSDPEGWHQLELSASLAVVASGLSAYAWFRQIANAKSALMGALIYMSAPYLLTVDYYQRFAFAELWGFVWMPLILMCAHRALHKRRGFWWSCLAMSYALLIMTHLPTTLLFSLLPVIYAWQISDKAEAPGAVWRIAGGMLLGIGLAAIYLVPAMSTQGYVLIEGVYSSLLDFRSHFLFTGRNPGDLITKASWDRAVMLSIMMFVAASGWVLSRAVLSGVARKVARFWLIVSLIAYFMMLKPSQVVWDWVPVIQHLQFPWRFGIILTLAMASIIVLWLNTANNSRFSTPPGRFLVVTLIFVLQLLPLSNYYSKYAGTEPSLGLISKIYDKPDPYSQTLVAESKINRFVFFQPEWSNTELFKLTPDGVNAMAQLSINHPDVKSMDENSIVRSVRWQPPEIEFTVESKAASVLALHQFYYPGWDARLKGTATSLSVFPIPPNGLLGISVPPGNHVVQVDRGLLPAEYLGRVMTSISILLLMISIVWSWRKAPWPEG